MVASLRSIDWSIEAAVESDFLKKNIPRGDPKGGINLLSGFGKYF